MSLARLARCAMVTVAVMVAGPAAGGGPPGSPDEFELPAGTRPFRFPIRLRYGAASTYTYVFRADIDAGGQRRIAEGWVMQGTLRTIGDRLEWSYSLSNIGRDERLRERGALKVTTDPWGMVRTAEVLTDRWPPPPG